MSRFMLIFVLPEMLFHECDAFVLGGWHTRTTTTRSVGAAFLSGCNSQRYRCNTSSIKESFQNAQEWDAERYQTQHSFVWKYGDSLVNDLLCVQKGDIILDVGCGTGELTTQISKMADNVFVIGIDSDPNMIQCAKDQQACSNDSSTAFMVADIRNFTMSSEIESIMLKHNNHQEQNEPLLFDAVFSNAALHWVPEAELAVQNIVDCLKPGGRLVAELGAQGNIYEISSFLERATNKIQNDNCYFSKNPWYFPSISEYSILLEQNGMEVQLAQLYDRPTPLEGGHEGLHNWINMFGNSFLNGLSPSQIESVIEQAEMELKPKLFQEEINTWVADYRRIRIVAIKL